MSPLTTQQEIRRSITIFNQSYSTLLETDKHKRSELLIRSLVAIWFIKMPPPPLSIVAGKDREECYQIYFYTSALFIYHLIKNDIRRINTWIKYRTMFMILFLFILEIMMNSISYLLKLDMTESAIHLQCSIGLLSGNILMRMLHQFIYKHRPRYKTTSLFQCTALNYYKTPTFEEMMIVFRSQIKVEYLEHLDLNQTIQNIILHCYQPEIQ